MITEKGLAEKVMYCIHIDSHREVEESFREYIEFIERLGNKKDDKLHHETCEHYFSYVLKESKEQGKWKKQK